MMDRRKSELRIIRNKNKRKRELQRCLSICIFTLALVVVFSALFFSSRTKAREAESQASYKYYKSIIVEKGDTLWNYAKEYGDKPYYSDSSDYVKEVISINSLKNDRITSGQYLILPYYSTGSAG